MAFLLRLVAPIRVFVYGMETYLCTPAWPFFQARVLAPEFSSFHFYQVIFLSIGLHICNWFFSIIFLLWEFKKQLIFYFFYYLDTSLLSVSDTEVLQFDWTFSPDQERENDSFNYFVKTIGKASNNCCYNCATLTDNKQLLAVTTSKDNILLYNIDLAEQIFEYVGHTGLVY